MVPLSTSLYIYRLIVGENEEFITRTISMAIIKRKKLRLPNNRIGFQFLSSIKKCFPDALIESLGSPGNIGPNAYLDGRIKKVFFDVCNPILKDPKVYLIFNPFVWYYLALCEMRSWGQYAEDLPTPVLTTEALTLNWHHISKWLEEVAELHHMFDTLFVDFAGGLDKITANLVFAEQSKKDVYIFTNFPEIFQVIVPSVFVNKVPPKPEWVNNEFLVFNFNAQEFRKSDHKPGINISKDCWKLVKDVFIDGWKYFPNHQLNDLK